jgi:uncharacterized protein (DUF1499 family)
MTGGAPLAALFGRGPAGLPPPEPIAFARLVLPHTPNAFLAAPPGHQGPKHRTLPPLPVSPDAAWAVLRALGDRFPRCWRLAEWPELRQAQWVERTPLMNFPDIVAAQIVPLPDGAGLHLYSRSLFGRSDLGTNRRRVERWLAALDAALGAR